MTIGLYSIDEKLLQGRAKSRMDGLLRALFELGFEVSVCKYFTREDKLTEELAHDRADCGLQILIGASKPFVDTLGFAEGASVKEDDNGDFLAVIPRDCDPKRFFEDDIFLTIAQAERTKYCTFLAHTYGVDEETIRDRLKDLIRNRKRIAVTTFPSLEGVEVAVRYSSNMSKMDVDGTIDECLDRLKDCVYATGDTSIERFIVEQCREKKSKIVLAESFTGGGIASKLVSVAGASDVLVESIVAYTESAKVKRLKVDPQTLRFKSAVSLETAYLMAAGALEQNPEAEYVVSATGYAGPDGQEVGKCILGVGNRKEIHLFQYQLKGTREEITTQGIAKALTLLAEVIRGRLKQ